MTVAAETRQLSLHPLAIHTFIKAQAGSLGKALSESVMNSIDAFASTVEITLSEHGFCIEDDGQGFKSREEISNWFETIGFPHDEGNHRVFGKFGMGRAQQWAYASTVWQSNQFTMTVDVRKTGLDYQLVEAAEKVNGTRITGTFYSMLSPADVVRVQRELGQLLRYAPVLVTLNGKAVNSSPLSEKWDIETDEAYMRFDARGNTLTVYNNGVLVAHFPRYRFSQAGVIVTKPAGVLELNVARNEILEAECPVWRRIVQSFPKKLPKKVTAPAPAEPLRETGELFRKGEIGLEEALRRAPHLLVSVTGRILPLSALAYPKGCAVTVAPKGDKLGKKILNLGLAQVVAKESLNNLGFASADQLREALRVKYFDDVRSNARWTNDARAGFPALAVESRIFSKKELTELEQAVLAALSFSPWPHLTRNMDKLGLPDDVVTKLRKSRLYAGESLDKTAWYGEDTMVIVCRKQLNAAYKGRVPGLLKFLTRMILDVFSSMDMPAEVASRAFIKLMTDSDAVGLAGLQFIRRLGVLCQSRGLESPLTLLTDLDQMTSVPDEADEPAAA